MRLRLLGTFVAAAALFASDARADVRVAIAGGRVTIVATNATPRQILDEWARVGRTRIINAERLTGPATSIDLENVPEAQALDTVLRSAGGYVAAPRGDDLPNASQYDRIFILATSSPVRAAGPVAVQSPAPFQPPVFPPGADAPPDDQQGRPGLPGQPGAVPQRAPVFTTFPQPQPVPPFVPPPQAGSPAPQTPSGQPATAGATSPGGVVGSARPGMPVPVPQQPGQAGQPVPPGQPVPGQPQLVPGQR
jgi:hypothetical protein